MNDQDNMNEEMPAVSGCPSLGPKVLPSGFDGVEPLVRTDYESIIADIFHKCNEAFIHAPQQREARPMYFNTVVGDIAEALASVVPCDNRGRGSLAASDKDGTSADDATRTSRTQENDVYRTPQPIVDFCISEMQRMEARKNLKIHWKTYETKADVAAMGKTRQNGKVYEIRVTKRTDQKKCTEFFCVVNGTTVLEGTFGGSAWTAKRILEFALQELVNMKARRSRQRRLAEKRRVGILTQDQELAETVKRQKED